MSEQVRRLVERDPLVSPSGATAKRSRRICLARLKALRRQRDAVTERTAAGLPAKRALEWRRALGESLQAPEKSME